MFHFTKVSASHKLRNLPAFSNCNKMLDRKSMPNMVSLMNKFSNAERVRIVSALVEGNSLRSIVRMTGTHRTTIQKLLVDLGIACSNLQSRTFKNLPYKHIECDEIWSFIGSKAKKTTPDKKAEGCGDVWTWVTIIPQYLSRHH